MDTLSRAPPHPAPPTATDRPTDRSRPQQLSIPIHSHTFALVRTAIQSESGCTAARMRQRERTIGCETPNAGSRIRRPARALAREGVSTGRRRPAGRSVAAAIELHETVTLMTATRRRLTAFNSNGGDEKAQVADGGVGSSDLRRRAAAETRRANDRRPVGGGDGGGGGCEANRPADHRTNLDIRRIDPSTTRTGLPPPRLASPLADLPSPQVPITPPTAQVDPSAPVNRSISPLSLSLRAHTANTKIPPDSPARGEQTSR